MTSTVGDQVYARVTALVAGDAGMSRAQALRTVAVEMGRSVPATSSAFYAGAKRSREADGRPAAPARGGRRTRASGTLDATRLYAEMLPLVEAGATVEQAARRFGDEDAAEEIAAGFSRWMERGQESAPAGDATGARIAALEAENRALREALERARAILEAAAGPS
ncbi:MAG: hypothetical protein JHC74_08420 [Thermoleophilia bacterium]|nr:hypothetical protein [Thermoleophilia bacterium]